MSINKKLNRQSGLSLLEVLIFVSIVSVFFIAAGSVATISLRDIKSDENKIYATRYAEELLEWIRGEKEEDWDVFRTTRAVGVWCFHQKTLVWPTGAAACTANQLIDSRFKREANLTPSGTTRVNVTITVSWFEGDKNFSIPINTILERFE